MKKSNYEQELKVNKCRVIQAANECPQDLL